MGDPIDGTYCYSESGDDIPMSDLCVPSNDFEENEEYVVDMIYNNSLDVGPMLFDDPPCEIIVPVTWSGRNIIGSDDHLLI
jgi:hypothetical protein